MPAIPEDFFRSPLQPEPQAPPFDAKSGKSRITAIIKNIHAENSPGKILALLTQIDAELATGTSKKTMRLLEKELARLHGSTDEKVAEKVTNLQNEIAKRLEAVDLAQSAASVGKGKQAVKRVQLRFEPLFQQAKPVLEEMESLSKTIATLTTQLNDIYSSYDEASFLEKLFWVNYDDVEKIDELEEQRERAEKQLEACKQRLHDLKAASEPLKRHGKSQHYVALDPISQAAVKEAAPYAERVAQDMASLEHISDVVHVAVKATVDVPLTGTDAFKTKVTGVVQPLLEHAVVLSEVLGRDILSRIDQSSYEANALFATLNAAWDLHPSNVMLCIVPNDAYNSCIEKSWEYQLPSGEWQKVSSFDQLVFGNVKAPIREQGSTVLADVQDALNVQFELRQFDNERILNMGRGERHGHDPNLYQLWRGQAVLPTRDCLLGLPDAHLPLSDECCSAVQSLERHRASLRLYTTQGDPLLWQHLSVATRKELLQFFQSDEYKHFQPAGMEIFQIMPRRLQVQVYNELVQASLRAPDLPEVRAFMEEEINAIKKQLSAIGASDIRFEVAARSLIRQLHNYARSEKSCSELCEEVIQEFPELASIRLHAQAMDKKIGETSQLVAFRNELKELRAGNDRRFNHAWIRGTLGAVVQPERLFPPIAPQEARAQDARISKSIEYIDTCKKAVIACKELRGAPDAVAQAREIIKNHPGLALDEQPRLLNDAAQGDDFFTTLEKALEPTSLGMHFYLYPKVRLMMGILTHLRVEKHCRDNNLPVPTRSQPQLATLYVQAQNQIFLEMHRYHSREKDELLGQLFVEEGFNPTGSYSYLPCAIILEWGKSAGFLSEDEYAQELARIKQIA